MTDQPRRTTLLPAVTGWLRHFIVLLLAAITALPLTAAPRPDIKGRVISVAVQASGRGPLTDHPAGW